MKRFLIVSFLLLLIAGCGRQSELSNIKGLGATANGKNIALLFGSPAYHDDILNDDGTVLIPAGPELAGVLTDIREMSNTLTDPKYNFHFSTVTNNRAHISDILGTSAKMAKNADSLLWFFSGHGGSGYLFAEKDGEDLDQDGSYHFSQVAEVIKTARQNKPLKRLVVLLDACHSGEYVDGEQPIIDRAASVNNFLADLERAYDQHLYEQAFVMASSLSSETSADLGAELGGAFTNSVRTSFAELKVKNPSATFLDWAKLTTEKTKKLGGHTPIYRAFPVPNVINDHIFIY